MTVDNSACFSISSKHLIPCGVCSKLFKPRQKNSKYCSQLCHGRRKRYVVITCIVCNETKLRERRGAKDATLCCSRECGFVWQAFIRYEVNALKRISQNVKNLFITRIDKKIVNEIRSLKYIGVKNKKLKICKLCGEIVYSKYVKLHPTCRKEYYEIKKAEYKLTESHKATKKALRDKRKALQRGATIASSINPIDILERDNWRCYLCEIETPKELRGSYQDNAPEVDHVIPLSKGGLHIESNLRCSCRKCNAKKSDQIYQLI